jgi:hypothetical protein
MTADPLAELMELERKGCDGSSLMHMFERAMFGLKRSGLKGGAYVARHLEVLCCIQAPR